MSFCSEVFPGSPAAVHRRATSRVPQEDTGGHASHVTLKQVTTFKPFLLLHKRTKYGFVKIVGE